MATRSKAASSDPIERPVAYRSPATEFKQARIAHCSMADATAFRCANPNTSFSPSPQCIGAVVVKAPVRLTQVPHPTSRQPVECSRPPPLTAKSLQPIIHGVRDSTNKRLVWDIEPFPQERPTLATTDSKMLRNVALLGPAPQQSMPQSPMINVVVESRTKPLASAFANLATASIHREILDESSPTRGEISSQPEEKRGPHCCQMLASAGLPGPSRP